MSDTKTRMEEMMVFDDYRVDYRFTMLDVVQQWALSFRLEKLPNLRAFWFARLHDQVLKAYGGQEMLRLFGGDAAGATKLVQRFKDHKPCSAHNELKLVTLWLARDSKRRQALKEELVMWQPHEYLKTFGTDHTLDELVDMVREHDSRELEALEGHERHDPE